MKKIRKVISVLMCTAMLLSLMSISFSVFAANADYDVWVNGEKFDAEKLVIKCGEGTASYDAETKTLYLDNAEITQGYEYQPYYVSAIYSELDNLNICLKGYNSINLENNHDCDGIDCAPGCNVTIFSDVELIENEYGSFPEYGMLDITGGYYGTYIGSYEAEGGNLTVKDCYLWVWNTTAAGIWVNHDITIENSMVNVVRSKQAGYNGIVSNIDGTVTITGSMVDVINNASAFLLGNGDSTKHKIIIDSGSTVQAHSKNGYGFEFVPDSETEEVKGEIQLLEGVIASQCAEGTACTNIKADKITTAPDKELGYVLGDLTSDENTVVQTVQPYADFPDVKEGAWYFDSVKYNAQRGYVTGYQNGNFGPSDNIKRQDFAIILARFSGVDLSEFDTGEATAFSDVAPNAYYAPAVRWAYENEIIMGYQNGKFGVGDNITREQICTIFFRSFEDDSGEGAEADGRAPEEILAPYTTDSSKVSPWAKQGVAWCVENGIVSGKNATTLAPLANCSRAEAAAIFMNAQRFEAQFVFEITDFEE